MTSAIASSATSNLPLRPDRPQQDDDRIIDDRQNWLSFHRIWGRLNDDAMRAIATAVRTIDIEPETEIYRQDLQAIGLYLIEWGSVEIYRNSSVGKTHITYRSSGETFGYVPLTDGSDRGVYRASAIAVSKSRIWFVGRDDFEKLCRLYPDVQTAINRLLSEDLANFARRLAKERDRIRGLQFYICPIPKNEAVIGNSKASQAIRKQVDGASEDMKPVVLQAPPGSGKTFFAGLIHARSSLRDRPFAEIDCIQLPRDETGVTVADIIFGNEEISGTIELLERGTLLIDNAHLLTASDRDRLLHYLQTGILDNSTPSWVRIVLASSQKLSLPDVDVRRIKLFSAPQRKGDIPDIAESLLAKFCRERGRDSLKLDRADVRRLVSYNYPGNFAELEGILKRAVVMTPDDRDTIPEQVLWSVESSNNAFRIDLLNQFPWLRKFLLSAWWPQRFWIPMMAIFIPVTVMGYIGPQTRDASVTLNLFWAWWWPFYLLLFPVVGRVWCAVCPFMIMGEWVRKISLWIWPRKLLPWPTKWLDRWGAWFLFAGFVAIYLWEKLWDLPHTPYLSSWLLVIIALGAVVGSIIYERRLWCRYLCPIGGMNGMFAKLAAIELRSTQQICGSQCSTFSCYKGSGPTVPNFADPLPAEGQETVGCPLYSHPAQLKDNRDCVLCMTCLKACPNRSVQFNLRFPATDLLENHRSFPAEMALMLLLLGGVFMHRSDRVFSWLHLEPISLSADNFLVAFPVTGLLLAVPFVFTYLTHAIARLFDKELPDYQTIAYAYLPLTLGANIAYYLPAAITESGKILPVIARTFGFSGEGVFALTWSLDVAQFLQGVALLLAIGFSIYPLLKMTNRPVSSNFPYLLSIAALTVVFFPLLI